MTETHNNDFGGNPSWWGAEPQYDRKNARMRRFLSWMPLCVGLSLFAALFVALTVSIPFAIIEFILCMLVVCGVLWKLEGD